jgi:hypothetical protein
MARKTAPLHLVPGGRQQKGKRPAPVEYLFNPVDLDRFRNRFWRISRENAEAGFFSRIWRGADGVECPSASCILPALALNAWVPVGAEWSPPVYLSHRTIAALAGVDKNSVARGMRRLEEVGLLRMGERERMARHGGAHRRAYQLSAECFPEKGQRFFKLPGGLAYGGALAMLPRASARHLFLVIAALDPLYDEEELRAHMADDAGRDVEASIKRRRHESTSTLSEIVGLSGLASSTAQEALQVLMAPVFGPTGKIPLVRRDRGAYGLHYFVDAEAVFYTWSPSVLNDRGERARTRRHFWGSALGRAA